MLAMDKATVLYPLVTGLGAVAGVLVTAAYTWLVHPDLVIRAAFRFSLYWRGFSIKYAPVGKYMLCYAERGQPSANSSSLVLVHGFSASKDMWALFVRKLPKDLHVILIDLPGHGDSTIPGPEDDVSLDKATEDLHKFVQTIDINSKPFHLVGISMGGAISQNYAVHYPEDIERLTLICPAMRTPEETPFQREIADGHCMLIVDNITDLKTLFQRVSHSKPNFSNPVLRGLLKMRLPRNEYMRRLFKAIQKIDSGPEGREFEERAKRIQAPTQIVWGREDELLHVSGAELLRSRLPNCQRVDILDACGHSCCLDGPGRLAKCVLQFRGDLQQDKSKSQ